MRDAGNLVGLQFGRLTVLRFDGRDLRGNKVWACVCRCGGFCRKTTSHLRDKIPNEISCGCARRESISKASKAAWAVTTRFSHPYKLNLKWTRRNMIGRCHKPYNKSFDRYGGKGISVCKEWLDNPTSFYQWAIDNGYRPRLEIERKDYRGNYCPENCCFADDIAQANNTSKNLFVEFEGKRLTLAQWAREKGLKYTRILRRYHDGFTPERILAK